MNCPKCGSEIADGQKFCPNCGKAAPKPKVEGAVEKKFPLIPVVVSVIAVALIGILVLLFVLVFKKDDAPAAAPVAKTEVTADAGDDGESQGNEPAAQPAAEPEEYDQEKPEPTEMYGETLEYMNNEIKINGTTSQVKDGEVKYGHLFDAYGGTAWVPIKIKIKNKRRTAGTDYVDVFDVSWNYMDNPIADLTWGPSMKNFVNSAHFIQPIEFFTVFDYDTGKSLEIANDQGVVVNDSGWKHKVYKDQNYKTSNGLVYSWHNKKKTSVSFTVTYPQTAKNVCVGIGFRNIYNDKEQTGKDQKYWEGYAKYGETSYYKKSKTNCCYAVLGDG